MEANNGNRVYNILLGMDEPYTHNVILNCFKYRKNYNIYVYDRNDKKQEKLKEKLFFDIYWQEYEDLDFEKLIYTDKRILCNSYCIRKGFIRKAHVAYYIKKYLLKNPNSILSKTVPETYIFELDYLDYLDEAMNECFEIEIELKENEKKILKNQITTKFILKSSLTNKGAEILIFDRRSQLENYFTERVRTTNEDESDNGLDLREWVIQRYIHNPFLINERKFHLRVYLLAVGNCKVYVYDKILALFSLNEYNINDFSKNSLNSHITNTCVQYDHALFEESECVKEFWSLKFDQLNDANNQLIKNNIFNNIKSCVADLIKSLYSEKIVFQPLDNAFELYGLDFLIDSNLNCFFLEANAFPDFKQTGSNLNNLISDLFYQTIALSVDNYFKQTCVCDPINMHLVYESGL